MSLRVLSDIEQRISKTVVQRLVDANDWTPRRLLLREFKGDLPEALSDLVNKSVLKQVGGSEAFLPWLFAFHCSGDSELVRFGRSSLEQVLAALRTIFEQELEAGDQKEHGQDDVQAQVRKSGNSVDPLTIRVGLYLSQEFGVFESARMNPQQTEVLGMKIGERILTIGAIDRIWNDVVARNVARLEANNPQSPPNFASRLEDGHSDPADSKSNREKEIPVIPRPVDGEKATRSELGSTAIEAAARALSDKPSLVDLLEFEDYAQALVDLIQNPKTQTPLTIGIDGPWGSGKSTLMEMMQSKFDALRNKKSATSKFHTVWFNAWKYDREESVWAALALEILLQVKNQLTARERIALWFKLNIRRFDRAEFIKDQLPSLLLPGVIVVLAAACLKLWNRANPNPNWVKWSSVTVGTGGVAYLSLLGRRIYQRLLKPFDLNISKYVRTPDYKQRIGFLHEFERDFRLVVEAVTHKGKTSLVVFIDDLDRCEPAKPVEVIEAINHLLDAKSCVFVIGMDTDAIAASVVAKYEQLQVVGGTSTDAAFGYRFLEKIIQIPFRLPKPSGDLLNRLVEGNLDPRAARDPTATSVIAEVEDLIVTEETRSKATLQDAAKRVEQARPDLPTETVKQAQRNVFARSFDDDEEVRRAIYRAVPFLGNNARKIKRFINLFRLNVLIANRRGLLERGVIQIDRLANWIILVSRWPDFVEHATDPSFLKKLSDAQSLRSKTLATYGPESTEKGRTLLTPFMEDPRIRRFVDIPDLFQILSLFAGPSVRIDSLPDLLLPYVSLAEVAGPVEPKR